MSASVPVSDSCPHLGSGGKPEIQDAGDHVSSSVPAKALVDESPGLCLATEGVRATEPAKSVRFDEASKTTSQPASLSHQEPSQPASFSTSELQPPLSTDLGLVWLISDNLGTRQALLRDRGMRSHSIDLRNIAGRPAFERVLRDLVSQRPVLLWFRVQGCASAAGSRLDRRLSWFVHRLASEQIACGRDVIFEGSI